jgi:NAD(P)-dependent dehydrogenase (short-subunit alcohol dehydrogenase family)
MGRLDGKIAVITGGSTGMGLATAKLFVREGAKVVITGRDQAALDAAVEAIGHDVDALRGDISNMADIDALRTFVAAKHGRVDILFANAGGARPGPFGEVSEEDYDFTVDTNLKGSFFTMQKLVPLMPTGGSVILNTSIQASKGFPGFAVYAATKAALRSLARTLTAELSPGGIRVNALAPGFIDTDIMRKIGMSEEMIAEIKARSQTQIPMDRMGTGDDIARVALFLASDDAGYVTGIELTVDGGSAQV